MTEDDAETLAEQLIAVADRIALQALFDPAGWPADRQVARLRDTIEPIREPLGWVVRVAG